MSSLKRIRKRTRRYLLVAPLLGAFAVSPAHAAPPGEAAEAELDFDPEAPMLKLDMGHGISGPLQSFQIVQGLEPEAEAAEEAAEPGTPQAAPPGDKAPIAAEAAQEQETPPLAAGEPGEAAVPEKQGDVLRAWSVVPRLTLSETLTDNVDPARREKRADLITELTPGIHIVGKTPRASLFLDYQRREFAYAKESGHREHQNNLNAIGQLEAVEKWMFVDVSGVVWQQQIAPFGQQSASDAGINRNRTESANFRVSPFIRGELAQAANYELRFNRSWTHTKAEQIPDVDVNEWLGRVMGRTFFSSLGWSLDASRRKVDYRDSVQRKDDHVRGMLSYQLSPQFKLFASAGREANDFDDAMRTSNPTHGHGFLWSPTPRTQLSAFREKRFFGQGYDVAFSHRTPLTAWKFTNTRDVVAQPNQIATGGMGSLYDLFFQQLASAAPEPVARARETESLLEQNNLPPNLQAVSGFLVTNLSLQRRQELSFAVRGARNVLTLIAVQSENQQLGPVTGPNDPFIYSPTIRQRGASAILAHRLSPTSVLNLWVARQNNSASTRSDLDTTQNSGSIFYQAQLGPKTRMLFGVRRSVFSSANLSYGENAVLGSVALSF